MPSFSSAHVSKAAQPEHGFIDTTSSKQAALVNNNVGQGKRHVTFQEAQYHSTSKSATSSHMSQKEAPVPATSVDWVFLDNSDQDVLNKEGDSVDMPEIAAI